MRVPPTTDVVRVSECAQWSTGDRTPFGPLVGVRCPDRDHCLQLAAIIPGNRIGPHNRNTAGRCRWIGAQVLDDRKGIPAAALRTVGDVTAIDPRRAAVCHV